LTFPGHPPETWINADADIERWLDEHRGLPDRDSLEGRERLYGSFRSEVLPLTVED